jgi:hypothetical protein
MEGMHVVEVLRMDCMAASLWKSTIRDGLCVHIVMGGASCTSSFANPMEGSCGGSRQRRQAEDKFFLRVRPLIKLETLSFRQHSNWWRETSTKFQGDADKPETHLCMVLDLFLATHLCRSSWLHPRLTSMNEPLNA